MRTFIVTMALACVLIQYRSASADDLAIPDGSGDHMRVFSPLLAGMMGGALCNKNIDRSRATDYVREGLGSDVTFKADQVVFLTWMAYAQQAMQMEMGAVPKKPTRQYCSHMMSAFGPEGTQIKGLLSD